MLSLTIGSIVYISGPMRGYEDENGLAFLAAAQRLIDNGYEVRNPRCISEAVDKQFAKAGWSKPQYSDYLRADMHAISQSHAIYMLKGWDHSTGANRELRWATDLSMPIFFEVNQ